MRLIILVTFAVATVHGQESKDWNSLAYNQVDTQLQGKEHDCAINVYKAFKSGMAISDIADTILPQCGFTADEMNTWAAKVEKIAAKVSGDTVPERHTLTDSEVAEVTAIDPQELEAEKRNAASQMMIAAEPQTGGLDPAILSDPVPSTSNIQVDSLAAGPHGLFSMH